MFERFVDQARRVIVLAQEEARTLGHDYIGTEHILLGLLHPEAEAASVVLDDLGVELEVARTAIGQKVGRGSSAPGDHIPFTPRAKRCLEGALREAVRQHHNFIGPEHLLLGLLREPEGIAVQYLVERGLQVEHVRAATLARMEEETRAREASRLEEAVATGTEGPFGVSAPVRADGVEDFLAPTCPQCHAAIEETAAYKVVEVPEDGGGGRLSVAFVYCEACGRMLTSRIQDP